MVRGEMDNDDVVASSPTVVRQQITSNNGTGAASWTGPNLSAGGGRGLVAVKEATRVVAHIDMDAFYAQIEQLRDAALMGRPVAVVQYPTTMHNMKDLTPDDNRIVEGSASSIIAVSYEARSFGVKRSMKGGEAKKVCPELNLVQVPTRNGKADISLYRQNGESVVTVLERAGGVLAAVEKASIDEVYVDVTRSAQEVLCSVNKSKHGSSSSSSNINEGGKRSRSSGSSSSSSISSDSGKRSVVTGGGSYCGPASMENPDLFVAGTGEASGRGPAKKGRGRRRRGQRRRGRGGGGEEGDVGGEGGDGVKRDLDEGIEASAMNGGSGKRWEEIGEGGWAAVVLEATGTHVAGVDDDADDLAEGVSWWGRPEEAFTDDEKILVCGAAVVSRLRAAVRCELNYSCTAGVAHNKLLAKLCSNMHKPNAQTVLPSDKVEAVFKVLPVEKVRGWGGKLGVRIMEKLGVSTAGEVAAVGPAELQRLLGDVEGWKAWEKSRGLDRDPVKARSAPKSIGCSKTFPGKSKLTSASEIERWTSELSKELVERLAKLKQGGGQTPRTLTVSFSELQQQGRPKSASRCCRMVKAEVSSVVEACMKMVRGYKAEIPHIVMLGVSAHGFEEARNNGPSIESFFGTGSTTAMAAGAAPPLPPPRADRSMVPLWARLEDGDKKPQMSALLLPPTTTRRRRSNALGFDSETAVEAGVGTGEAGSKRPRAAGTIVVGGGGCDRASGGGGSRGCLDGGSEAVDVEAPVAGEVAGSGGDCCAVEWLVEDLSRPESVEVEGLFSGVGKRGSKGGRLWCPSTAVVDLAAETVGDGDGGGAFEAREERDRRCDGDGDGEQPEVVVDGDEWDDESWTRRRLGGVGGGGGGGGDNDDRRGRPRGSGGRNSSSGACCRAEDGGCQDGNDDGDERLDAQGAARYRCGGEGGRGGRGFDGREALPSGADEPPRGGAVFGTGGGASGVLGEVDPEVLAELPVEIQREIWAQQGSQRRSAEKRAHPWGVGGGGSGSGSSSGMRNDAKGVVRRTGGVQGRGMASAGRGQGSISSFFGKSGGR